MVRRLFLVSLCVALTSCGGGSPSSPDAGGPPPDGNHPPCDCDPVVGQSCCIDGDKCAPVHQGAADPITTCTASGPVPTGGVCTIYPPMPGAPYDDCEAGNVCIDGACHEICTRAPDSCGSDTACVVFNGLFEGFEGIGACMQRCDAVWQDCEQNPMHEFGTGCYLSLSTGVATCGPARAEPSETMPGTQGDDCQFLNTCAVGYGCTLLDDPFNPTSNTCAYFCDATLGGGPTCGEGPGSAYTCVAINGGFYSDATAVSPAIGFCVDCEVWSQVPGCQ